MSKFEVPVTFTVPDSIEGVEALLTVRGWERAAIVWAYTQGATKGHKPKTGFMTIEDFSGLGLSGLRSTETVRLYRDRWQELVDEDPEWAVQPGSSFTVPDLPWPPTGHSHGKADVVGPHGTVEQKATLVRELLDEPAVEEEVYREPARVDRAITVDARHTERNRKIVDPHVESENSPTHSNNSVSYRREEHGHQFLDALSYITAAAVQLTYAAESLVGVELTATQRKQLETRYERLAGKLDLLRASTSEGSIDDELAAILAEGIE